MEHYGQYIVTHFTLNRNSNKNKRFQPRHVTNSTKGSIRIYFSYKVHATKYLNPLDIILSTRVPTTRLFVFPVCSAAQVRGDGRLAVLHAHGRRRSGWQGQGHVSQRNVFYLSCTFYRKYFYMKSLIAQLRRFYGGCGGLVKLAVSSTAVSSVLLYCCTAPLLAVASSEQ